MNDISQFISELDLKLVDVQCSTCGNPLKSYRYAVKIGQYAEDSHYCFENAPWRIERDRINQKARSMARAAVRSGKLIKHPCEICGNENVEGHHEDYSKPLEVRWLCWPHHHARHAVMLIELMVENGVEFKVGFDKLPTLEDYYLEYKEMLEDEIERNARESEMAPKIQAEWKRIERRISSLFDDPHFIKCKNLRAMKAYANQKIPKLVEWDEEAVKELIVQFRDRNRKKSTINSQPTNQARKKKTRKSSKKGTTK